MTDSSYNLGIVTGFLLAVDAPEVVLAAAKALSDRAGIARVESVEVKFPALNVTEREQNAEKDAEGLKCYREGIFYVSPAKDAVSQETKFALTETAQTEEKPSPHAGVAEAIEDAQVSTGGGAGCSCEKGRLDA